MASRRFAGLRLGTHVNLTKTIVIAVVVGMAAASLAGCASAPLSLEEQLGFDKATGADITNQPPGLRYHAPGYLYPGERPYGHP